MFNVKISDKPGRREITLQVQPTTTVFDLQSAVSKAFDIPAMTSVLLFYQGAKLEERVTLQAAGVTAEATIQVNYRVGKTVNVIMPDGAMRRISVDEAETVESLAVKLGYRVGVGGNVSVTYNGELQDPAVTIQSLKMTDGDVLSLTTEVPGG